MTIPADEYTASRRALLMSPAERQDVEYKSSQPFDDSTEFGLKLIKHILGMANIGGGWIVIGYLDKPLLHPDPSHSDVVTATYEPTKLSNAVNQCVERGQQVRLAVSFEPHPISNILYPILRVEGFERVPYVCRSNKGGILVQGDVYVRRHGAETSRVSTVQDWEELISRCVSQQREEFLAQFADLSRRMALGHATPPEDRIEAQKGWMWDRLQVSGMNQHLTPNGGHLEFSHALMHVRNIQWPLEALRDSAIAVGLDNSYRTTPKTNGIEVGIDPPAKTLSLVTPRYWYLCNDGKFYLCRALDEDYRLPDFGPHIAHPDKSLWFDLTIVRIAQMLQRSVRLYKNLNIRPDEPYLIIFRHNGLEGRALYATSPLYGDFTIRRPISIESTHEWRQEVTCDQIESQLTEITYNIVNDLFALFQFAKVPLGTVQYLLEENLSYQP